MNRTILTLWSLGLAMAFAATACAAGQGQVKLARDDRVIRVEIDGKPFTTYYYADGKGRAYVRPFFYPVLASDGTEVTSDQVTSGGDHPHHRSLWVAQGNVNGADHWAFPRGYQPKQRHVKFNRVEGDTIQQQLAWEDKQGEPILNETRTLRFFMYPDGCRGIDFTLVFTPIDQPVTFGDTKEGGLCSVRVAKSMSANKATISNSTGMAGEKNIWGKKAEWCDVSGPVGGKNYGVAILDHPGNPRHPSNWHVREYGLMGANAFGLHDYDKTLPAGAGNFTMTKDKPTTFKYRVVIHQGDAGSAALDEKFKAFAGK